MSIRAAENKLCWVGRRHLETEKMKEYLVKLNISKSAGPDDTPPRLLKELAQDTAGPLAMNFETSWRTGETPEDWRELVLFHRIRAEFLDIVCTSMTYMYPLRKVPLHFTATRKPRRVPLISKGKVYRWQSRVPLQRVKACFLPHYRGP